MRLIKKYVDMMKDEIESAKEYAEQYVEHKVKNDMQTATRYKEMANDELKHAGYIHDRVVVEIETLRKVYTPPQDMLDKWDADHKKYIEKTAWIRQMLAM